MNIFNLYEKRCSSWDLFRFSVIWALIDIKNWPLLEGDFDFNLFSRDFDIFFTKNGLSLRVFLKGSPGGGGGRLKHNRGSKFRFKSD